MMGNGRCAAARHRERRLADREGRDLLLLGVDDDDGTEAIASTIRTKFFVAGVGILCIYCFVARFDNEVQDCSFEPFGGFRSGFLAQGFCSQNGPEQEWIPQLGTLETTDEH
jgi:hypothetical protein